MPDDANQLDDLQALARAGAGLIYPSETDAPFEPFGWPAESSRETARDAVLNHAKRTGPVEDVSLADFFAELQGSDNAKRYKALRLTLESRLAGLKVIRVGERKVDVYLIGRTRAGDWAGLRTTSVET